MRYITEVKLLLNYGRRWIIIKEWWKTINLCKYRTTLNWLCLLNLFRHNHLTPSHTSSLKLCIHYAPQLQNQNYKTWGRVQKRRREENINQKSKIRHVKRHKKILSFLVNVTFILYSTLNRSQPRITTVSISLFTTTNNQIPNNHKFEIKSI